MPSPEEYFVPENIANNNRVVNFSQTLICSIAGTATGILAITGLYGFVCYFLAYVLASVFLLKKIDFKTETYFPSASSFWVDSISQGFMSFILFWTLSYDIVHLF